MRLSVRGRSQCGFGASRKALKSDGRCHQDHRARDRDGDAARGQRREIGVDLVQLRRELRLVDEHVDEVGAVDQVGEDLLDRYRLLKALDAAAAGAPDLRHATECDALEQGVLTERLIVSALRETAIRSRLLITALVLIASITAREVVAQITSQGVPKQVHLVVEGNRLIASNVRASSFDEFRLRARENVVESAEGEAVLLVVTNQRIIAYGLASGWRQRDRVPNERVERVSAEDFAGLVVTSERMLNFNGESGACGERERRVTQ